jgi:hypothetical protein
MKATFENTMDILVKAYLNDTLKHNDCQRCAVGNIVHAAGFPYYELNGYSDSMPPDSCGNWKALFVTFDGHQSNRKLGIGWFIEDPSWVSAAEKMINATGYTEEQLAKVEYAFETASKGKNEDDWMFNGLIAVLEVVAQIHGVDLDNKKVYEDKFTEIFASKA